MTEPIKNLCKRATAAALVLISLFALSGCQTTKINTTEVSDKEKTAESSKVIEKTTIPTLFFHGYSGTENSFKGMLRRLEKNQQAVKELVLTVGTDGQIQATGDLSGKQTIRWSKYCLKIIKITSGIKQNGSKLVFCI